MHCTVEHHSIPPILIEKASKEIGQRWTQEKLELLVDLVKDNYTFLTGALTNAKTKSMVDNKWRDIASAINSLAKETPFSTEKIKKKWFDVKSRANCDVPLFKKEAGRTGGGPKPNSHTNETSI